MREIIDTSNNLSRIWLHILSQISFVCCKISMATFWCRINIALALMPVLPLIKVVWLKSYDLLLMPHVLVYSRGTIDTVGCSVIFSNNPFFLNMKASSSA